MAMRDTIGQAAIRLPRTYRFGLTAASTLALVALAPQAALAQDAYARSGISRAKEMEQNLGALQKGCDKDTPAGTVALEVRAKRGKGRPGENHNIIGYRGDSGAPCTPPRSGIRRAAPSTSGRHAIGTLRGTTSLGVRPAVTSRASRAAAPTCGRALGSQRPRSPLPAERPTLL